jgi:hypothetical protein
MRGNHKKKKLNDGKLKFTDNITNSKKKEQQNITVIGQS